MFTTGSVKRVLNWSINPLYCTIVLLIVEWIFAVKPVSSLLIEILYYIMSCVILVLFYVIAATITSVAAISSSSTSSVPQVVTQNGEKTHKFTRLASYDDVIFTEHVLFVTKRRSKLHCAVQCDHHAACLAFTLTLTECRGHCIRLSAGGLASEASSGAKSFELLGMHFFFKF
jgi:hypothetical protein